MKRIYIISQYKAASRRERIFNKQVARYFCRKVTREGNLPVAPHLFYTQFLNDNSPGDRSLGIQAGLNELKNCDEFLLVTIDGIISEGMAREIAEFSRGNGPQRGHIENHTRKEMQELLKAVKPWRKGRMLT